MIGLDKLTPKQIEVLRQMVLFRCQETGKHEDDVGKLEPHRIRRGSVGGKYCPNNIKMVSHEAHDIYSSADRISQGQSTWKKAKKTGEED